MNTTIAGHPLNVPAGSFFSVTLANAELDLYVGSSTPYQLGGTFAIQVQNGTTIIAATGVHISFAYSGIGSVSLTNGQGAIVIGATGVAGVLTGDFAGNLSSLGASAQAQVSLSFNTSQTAAVNQTVTIGGHSITVNVAAGAWLLGLTNATVSFGDFLTLSGNFAFGSGAGGSTVYGASNVEVFFGDGPYRLPDGSVNPDAIGILVSDGFVGAVKESDGTFALYAQGHAQLVGLDGLTISGLVTIKINQTGRVVTDQIPTPPGADPMPQMPFTTGAYTQTVTGSVTLSAAGVFTVGGTFAFTLQPSGRVDVSIPDAHVDISVPINGVMTDVFGLVGAAKFSFGGGLGFQLQNLTLNGVTILGHELQLGLSTGPTPPPTAELLLPYAGQDIDVHDAQHQRLHRGSVHATTAAPGSTSRRSRTATTRSSSPARPRPASRSTAPASRSTRSTTRASSSTRSTARSSRPTPTRTTRSASSSSPARSPTGTARRTPRRTSSSSSSATATPSSRRRSSRAR